MGKTMGPTRQVGGALLPIYEVGTLQLGVNGVPTIEHFSTAPIAPYDVILGEDWLLKHRAVLDYTDKVLYSKDLQGRECR